jgi:hypothetical protein
MQTAQEIRNPQFKYFKKAKRSFIASHVRYLAMHNILFFQGTKTPAKQSKIQKMSTYSSTTSPTQTWRKSGRKTGAIFV